MKTLNEVIKALSICGRHFDCKGCPYENVPYPTEIGNTCKDIMHYDALYYMQDRIDECQESNPALTWPELRQMEGKSVWVEFLYEDGQHFDSDWFLVGFVSESFCDVIGKLGTSRLVKNDYWQAYRKERE